MICSNCEKLAFGLRAVFIEKEIIQMLTAEVMLLRTITQSEDKNIGNSIITKCLLAMPREKRGPLMEYMSRVAGFRISLDSCQHSSSGGGIALV